MSEIRKYAPFEYRIGRLSRDAEEATIGSKECVKINLAVKQSFEDNDTEWVSVVVWSDKLRPAAATLRKGQQIAVGGNLKRTPGRDGREFVDLSAFLLYRVVDIEVEDSGDDGF